MAIHLVFDLPKDKIIWDVGHQSYTHKILTGRKDGFDDLRKYGGMSGFPKRKESACDAFDTGHSSTSISAGLGYVCARDLQKEDYSVISVIGFPKSSIVPLSAFTRPSIRRIAVLFPAPFFPMSPVILPSGTSVRFEPGEEKEMKKLDFDQRISASIHNHHH